MVELVCGKFEESLVLDEKRVQIFLGKCEPLALPECVNYFFSSVDFLIASL